MVCIAVLPQLNQKEPGFTKPYVKDVDACLNTSDWKQQKDGTRFRSDGSFVCANYAI